MLSLSPVMRAAGLAGVLAAAGLIFPVSANADAAARGHSVAEKSDRSDKGFGDSRVKLEMVLTNAAGTSTRRSLTLTTLEKSAEGEGDRSLVVFKSPKDIDGTALLSHSRILEPDNQWLYLPALKRVKRISSANKSGPFVGSEFAFEDITGQELEKYEYTWLREEACGALTCDVVERIPRYENSGYTRQEAWFDQTHSQIRRIDYYDRKSALLKTQTLEDYRHYDDRIWRAQVFRMVNHQTGKKTDLLFSDYTFGVGLGPDDFVKGVLRRVR